MTLRTTDSPANAPEYIAQAAKTLGRSQVRRRVFDAIYAGKKQAKTVSELMNATGLSRVRVLQEGGRLSAHEVVDQERIDGETAYRKRAFIQHNKRKILNLAGNSAKLAGFPTKWSTKQTEALSSLGSGLIRNGRGSGRSQLMISAVFSEPRRYLRVGTSQRRFPRKSSRKVLSGS